MPRANGSAPAIDLSALSEPVVYVPEGEEVAEEIQEFVEHAYEFWLDNQDRWLSVELPNAETLEHVLAESRRYATQVREEPLTFQTKDLEEGSTVLNYRAREAIRRARKANA